MKRLDLFLFENGFYNSREKAKQAIESERVLVNGKIVTKPAFLCDENSKIQAKPFEFVSRGGFKLQKALEEFGISLVGRKVLDIGASTGGFTDVCLQNGADKVYAVDTGDGQLVEKIKYDKRVINLEKTNYLDLSKDVISDVDFVCIDVSFVSLKKFAEKLVKDFASLQEFKSAERELNSSLKEKTKVDIVALIKPQFEVGLSYAKKHKGIVKDEKVHRKVVEDVISHFELFGFIKYGLIVSPIKGGDGNTEFLVWFKI